MKRWKMNEEEDKCDKCRRTEKRVANNRYKNSHYYIVTEFKLASSRRVQIKANTLWHLLLLHSWLVS